MAATDMIRVRISPEDKERLTRMYAARGTTISHEVRAFLLSELEKNQDPLAVLDGIAASARRKVQASGLPEPSVDDIVAYVERIRDERQGDGLV